MQHRTKKPVSFFVGGQKNLKKFRYFFVVVVVVANGSQPKPNNYKNLIFPQCYGRKHTPKLQYGLTHTHRVWGGNVENLLSSMVLELLTQMLPPPPAKAYNSLK